MNRTLTLSRSFVTRVDQTPHTLATAAMFGIGVEEDQRIVLYDNLEVTLGPGRVIFVTGESGAGKSSLLKDIHAAIKDDPAFSLPMQVLGMAQGDDGVGAIVDRFGDWPLDRVLELLNFVGIAEAFVYLRTPQQLSDGQRYRYQLARYIHQAMVIEGRQPVVIVDEALAFLDRITARAVAYQIRRVASKTGICFVLATTHDDILTDLQPNTMIRFRLNMDPEVTEHAHGEEEEHRSATRNDLDEGHRTEARGQGEAGRARVEGADDHAATSAGD